MTLLRRFGPVRLSVEGLESREVPTNGGWYVEEFQSDVAVPTLPSNWQQWSSSAGQVVYRADPNGSGLGGQGLLQSDASSIIAGRAWVNTYYAADVEATAAVYLNSVAQSQLLVRGKDLNTATPSYYAAGVSRGTELQLMRVVRGQPTVLGSVQSTEYVSERWVTVTVRAVADRLMVFLHRGDTNQYLAANGTWTRQPTAAIERTDRTFPTGGYVGFARPAGIAGQIPLDSLRIGPPEQADSPPLRDERFSAGASGTAPAGWSTWAGGESSSVLVRQDKTLVLRGGSTAPSRVWMTEPVPGDTQVSSAVYVDSLVPAGVFARGSSVDGTRANMYEATLVRGLEVQLWRVVNGQRTQIGQLTTAGWQSGLWVQVSLVVKGDQLRVQVVRSDTGQYLNANGQWDLVPAWAMTRTDTAIRSGGLAGLSRGTGSSSDLMFDNFLVNTPPADLSVASRIPTSTTAQPAETPTPTPLPPSPPVSPPPVSPPPPASPPPPPASPPPPPASPPPPVTPTNPANSARPVVPRNFSHIRVANLAYYGTPLANSFEQELLRNSVDVVVPNLNLVDTVYAANSDTPQLVYTNVSNVYLGLLTDWLEYADRTGQDREAIFYHVNKATTFYGMSASAVAVNHFWGAHRGSETTQWTNVTQDLRRTYTSTQLGGAGESFAIGFTEKFREINFDLARAAGNGWRAELEYVSAVDALGRPTRWSKLATLSDTTGGLARSGQVLFDPPSDWQTASVNGSARLYYVRLRTVSGTAATAPVATTITGRDYANHNGNQGTIPAFDYDADGDGDGYLSDAEYARRKPGFNARFEYESRLTYPYYGPNRYATNPDATELTAWTIDYHKRFLSSNPKLSGFFVDNSTGRLAVDRAGLVETIGDYGVSYGKVLGALNRAIGPKWLLSNTAGGGSSVEEQIRQGVSFLEEFALRPMAANHVQFEDLAALSKYRRQLSNGKGFEILDSLSTNGDLMSDRMKLATLAMYYQMADPDVSMLMMNGGNEPASTWERHWVDAIRFNVGRPVREYSVFAQGRDPSNSQLTYKVYQREYQNALVLYKPLSYVKNNTGTTADNTATTHDLNGYYRPVRADGTLGAPVNRITLRNGEGVILAKV